MNSVKIILWVVAICSAIAAIMLLWNESTTSCGTTFCKVYETLFILVALTLTKEASSIEWEYDEE